MKQQPIQVIADTLGWDYQTTRRAVARGWPVYDPLALWEKVNSTPGPKPPLDILRTIVDSLSPTEPTSKVRALGPRLVDFQDVKDDWFQSGIEFELERVSRECDVSNAEWAREMSGGTKTTRRKIDQLNVDLFRTIASLEPSIRQAEKNHITSVDAHSAIQQVIQRFQGATAKLVRSITKVFGNTVSAATKVKDEVTAIQQRYNDAVAKSFEPVPLSTYWRMVIRIRRRANEFYQEYVGETDLSLRSTRHKIWSDELNRFAKFLKDATHTELVAGSLVPKPAFVNLISRANNEWRSDLEALPRRLAMDSISGGRDQVDVEQAVRREVEDMLNELAGEPPADRSRPNPLIAKESLDAHAWPNYTKCWNRLKELAGGRAKVNDDEIQQLCAATEKDREHRRKTWGFS